MIDPTETNQNMSSALSKSEVEELLKKGAYGAFMDDETRYDDFVHFFNTI